MESMTRGRKPTGLKRPNIIQVVLNDEEFEFISRESIETGIPCATAGRLAMLPRGWKEKLIQLRKSQNNAPLNSLDGRRKSV